MANVVTGLGGPQDVGENSFIGHPDLGGFYDDAAVEVDITSVFGLSGMNFYGTDYTSIWIGSDGVVTFGANNTTNSLTTISDLAGPGIAAFLTDHNPSGTSTGTDNIYWDLDTVNDIVTITWLGVSGFGSSDTNTFQLRLHANPDGTAEIELIYEDISFTGGPSKTGIAGYTDGSTNHFELPGSGDEAQVGNYPTRDFQTGDPIGIYSQNFSASGAPVCFCDGTRILTDRGAVRVEALRIGDLVATLEHGLQPIRWIGRRNFTRQQMAARNSAIPVRIAKHSFGPERPNRTLWVSQNHRILLGDVSGNGISKFVPAKRLRRMKGVSTRVRAGHSVCYYHLLFDRHEVIWANGLTTESLLLGAQAWANLGAVARREISAILDDNASLPPEPSGLRCHDPYVRAG